jgi:hypothetical protein
VIAAEDTGCCLACCQASCALRLKTAKNRAAHWNSLDQIHRPMRTGGMVSGPGRAVSAMPSSTKSRPARNTPIRQDSSRPGLLCIRSRNEPGFTGRGWPSPSVQSGQRVAPSDRELRRVSWAMSVMGLPP